MFVNKGNQIFNTECLQVALMIIIVKTTYNIPLFPPKNRTMQGEGVGTSAKLQIFFFSIKFYLLND